MGGTEQRKVVRTFTSPGAATGEGARYVLEDGTVLNQEQFERCRPPFGKFGKWPGQPR